ncbi:MAG: aldo/keto reductase, partial [Oscillospiraceae bacterium]|nr:aldo/keto reductase [Oscillospiraceae bacterium]
MRKITVILLTFTMILGLCACGAEERQDSAPADETASEIATQIIEAPSTTDDGKAAVAPAERAAFDFDTKTVTLNSGHVMPILGIGTYALSDSQAENSVYWALKAGYRLIDTARIYGNESGVGRGIKRAV